MFQKNAAQHSADLLQLEKEPSVNSIFINPLTERPKHIECVRVDGATDEGPGHNEIQFWWTLRHMQRPTVVTLVTTRSSGASYLNRVELQNGCLALGHANLFIPSNLNGSCFDPQTGKVDQDRLKKKWIRLPTSTSVGLMAHPVVTRLFTFLRVQIVVTTRSCEGMFYST